MLRRVVPLAAAAVALVVLAPSLMGRAGSASEDGCAPTGAAGLPEGDADKVLAALDKLYALFAGMPGFVDVYYRVDAAYHPTFVGEVPDEAHAVETEERLVFEVLPHEPVPVGAGTAPDPSDLLCAGIRPGARVTSPQGICTLAFLFTDGDRTYASTAGHCIRTGQTATVSGIGPVGVAVFSMNGGVGWDFALIRIDEAREPLVSGEMCDFAGPTGAYAAPWLFNHAVLQTGHGLGYGAAPPRAKVGWGVGMGARSFSYAGSSIFGDSGSPARIDSGPALGTVTHIGVGNGNNFGTRLGVGVAASGLDLELVTVPYLHPV